MKLALFGLLLFSFCLAGCGVPNLESPECSEARVATKQFYSFHFANDMTPSAQNLEERRKFLTDDLYGRLQGVASGKTDYFTKTDNYPKTFKIGRCTHQPDAKNLILQVQLYWRDDEVTVQKEVNVDAFHRGNASADDQWLIQEVTEVVK